MAQNQKITDLFSGVTVTPENIEYFRDVVSERKALVKFLGGVERSIACFEAFASGNAETRELLVNVLSRPDAVFDLAKNGKADDVMSLIEKLPELEQQIAVLSTPEVVWILTENGKTDDIMALIRNLPTQEQRITALSTPETVFGLAKNGKANEVFSLIRDLPWEQQAVVFSASNTIYGLADNLPSDQLLPLLSLIENFPEPKHRMNVLAAPYAIFGLVRNGKANEVIALIKNLPPEQQAIVLTAPHAAMTLIANGKVNELESLLEQLPREQHIPELSTRQSLPSPGGRLH